MTEDTNPRDEQATPEEDHEPAARGGHAEHRQEPDHGGRAGEEGEPRESMPRDEHTDPGEHPDPSALWAEATASTTPPGHAGAETSWSETGAETGRTGPRGEDADTATNGQGDTESHPADDVRGESWPCPQPAELDLSVDVGRIAVTLADGAGAVEVELRVEQSWGGGWHRGLTSVFNWLNEATGGSSSIRVGGREFSFGGLGGGHFDLGELAGGDLIDEAVRGAEVTWSASARRLVVRSSRSLPARLVPLAVTVRAPAGSGMVLGSGAGPITVSGRSGTADVHAGTGDVELDTVGGDLRLRTGSGAASVRAVAGRAKAKAGSGDITVDAVNGPAELQTGSGDLRLGGVRADLFARTGSGDLTVADAQAGRLDLTTGSGHLRVGVHPGVAAELDLRSGSGKARSELEVSDTAPATAQAALRIGGRTGSGDVLVTRALSAAGAAG